MVSSSTSYVSYVALVCPFLHPTYPQNYSVSPHFSFFQSYVSYNEYKLLVSSKKIHYCWSHLEQRDYMCSAGYYLRSRDMIIIHPCKNKPVEAQANMDYSACQEIEMVE